MRRVPMSAPDIHADDIALVVEVLQSQQLSMGPFVERFERAFADYVETRHAVAVSSGTAGLHLCICAARIGAGDEVITTPFSFVASANCVLYERAIPRFVDIDANSMNIDPARVRAAVTERTRAVLPVHVFGRPCVMDELEALCRTHGLALIEDACEAVGAEFRGRKVGTFGDAAVFGFYPNKQMTMGEGGVVTTNDADWAELLRSLRNQGRSKVAARYGEALRDVPGVALLSPDDPGSRMTWFVFVIRLDGRISRDSVIDQLKSKGVPTRTYFSPIHLQPYFRERFGYREGDFPIAERAAKTVLALPFRLIRLPPAQHERQLVHRSGDGS